MPHLADASHGSLARKLALSKTVKRSVLYAVPRSGLPAPDVADQKCKEASEKYYGTYDLVKGANIAGFEKVAEAMMAQGLV